MPVSTRFSHARFWLTLQVGLFCLWSGHLLAAEVPLDPALRMQDELRRAERSMPAAPSASRAEAAESVPPPQTSVLQGRIFLRQVLFSPSELLTESQLQDVVKPYLGREVGSDDLNALLRDIQALYLSQDVQSAVPVVPPQDLKAGELKVLLVEGTLGEVRFSGSNRPDPAWLSRWFDLPTGEVVRSQALTQRLEVFNAASDFTAQGQFVAGQQFGKTDLEIALPEPVTTQYWALTEVPGLGSGRTLGNSMMAGLRYYPVSSLGGRIDATAIAGPTAYTLSVSGGLPLGYEGWRLAASLSASRSRTVVTSTSVDASDLVIDGESSSAGLELMRHVYAWPGQVWRFSGALLQLQSSSNVDGNTLTDRSVQRFSLVAATDWPLDSGAAHERASLRLTLNSGKGRENSYSYAEAFGSVAYRLHGPLGPVMRLNGQARLMNSHRPDAADVWIAGGSASVRGFDPGSVFGSSGQALQVALHQPLLIQGIDASETFVFSDHARVSSDGNSRRIGSVGMGLQFQFQRRWMFETAITRQTQGFQGPRTRWLARASVFW